ncbi:MAG TPA: glycosyltransferase [Acidimicrobiales bacterium]|nr:glycosyltransferase [Acidimicrobiales bacterium]
MVTELDPFSDNVSVIVLNYNQATTTVECLDALAAATSELIREIIVVDNGSTDAELSILRESQRKRDYILVQVGINRFFGEGNNIGVDFARGDYVVFLNNDAFVQRGWIEALCSTMRSDPLVAAVGPMFLYPDGRVQEVGGVIVPTGDAVQIGKGAVWGPDHYDTPCLVDYCSAACLMMRRSDFLEVGGFGLEWEPAYYEDTDLCLKLWTRCGKVMVNPNARVVHIESKTTSDSRLKLHDISEINRARFVKKWGPWLEARQTASLANPALASQPDIAERSTADLGLRVTTRPTPDSQFVLYSPYPLVPGGGERMLFELASVLSSVAGTSNVVFASPERYSTIRIRQIEAIFGFDNVIGTALPREMVEPENCRFAAVIGNTIVPPSEAFGTRSVYHIQFPFWVPDREVEEYGYLLAGYDEIWAYSEFVRHNINGLIRHYGLEAPPIRLIRPHAMWSGPVAGLPWPERRTLLTVGRFFAGGHNKRQDVVIRAFRRMVELGMEGMELALAGAIHPSPEGRQRFRELQDLAEGLPCTFYPNIGRSDLAALYGESAVLIHAAGFGVDGDEFPERLEHFGITPIEAASFGCIPVVYGQGGPRDVLHTLGSHTTFDTIEECARIVTRLVGDPQGSSLLSAHLLESCHAYSPQAYAAGVTDSLRDLGLLS